MRLTLIEPDALSRAGTTVIVESEMLAVPILPHHRGNKVAEMGGADAPQPGGDLRHGNHPHAGKRHDAAVAACFRRRQAANVFSPSSTAGRPNPKSVLWNGVDGKRSVP